MKRIICTLLIILCITNILTITLAVYNWANDRSTFELPDYKEEISYSLDGLNVSSVGPVEHRKAQRVIDALHKLGPIAKEQSKYGVVIVDVSQMPETEAGTVLTYSADQYYTAGTFQIGSNQIKIADKGNSAGTLYHEMGHYVDFNYLDSNATLSNSKTWKTILQNEFKNTSWDLYYTDRREFFAECFQSYFDNPEWLKQHCPEAYDFIGDIVVGYEN